MTDFLAVDGEAINDKYCLLACSDGRHALNLDELSTKACFDFLLDLGEKGKTLVCFGLNYDVNMWLRDLNREALEYLWHAGDCVHTPKNTRDPEKWYKLSWLPGHRFQIKQAGRKVTIYEVWGFFQSSFVNACHAWGLETSEELAFMKGARGTFSDAQIQRVIDYCLSECKLLVDLMNRLQGACEEANIVPREWMGAGALAAKMLADRRHMKAAHKWDEQLAPEKAQTPILQAYFGGRVELLRQGEFQHVHTADIRSAYPYAITGLPSLENVELVHRKRYDPKIFHGIWHVRWDGLRGQVMPFPFRKKKAVYYPSSGEGWYHACEVKMAYDLGYKFDVLEGWVIDKRCEYPFTWVKELYNIRGEWKRQGLATEKILKLGLNSLYGKLAQGMGFGQKKPSWQSYFWAGEITARTRARMLGLTGDCHSVPIMIATDGVFFQAPYEVKDVDELGGMEIGYYESLFTARAGVYLGEHKPDQIAEDGSCKACGESAEQPNSKCKKHPTLVRSRGFFAREVNFRDLREVFEEEGVHGRYEYKSHRFIGIGSALMRTDFSVWRTWEDSVRSLSFMPVGKKVDMSTGEFWPVAVDAGVESEPYEPKGVSDTILDRVQSQEQPMKGD